MADAHQPDMHHQGVTGWTGWIMAAVTIMSIVGLFHIILGIGALFGQDWYMYASGSVWLFDSSAWGWSMIIGGFLLMLSAGLLMAGNMAGRILGTIVVLGSLIANLALAPAAPVWSITMVVLDVIILYAILAHGKEMKQLAE
jgi:hypothetical protein